MANEFDMDKLMDKLSSVKLREVLEQLQPPQPPLTRAFVGMVVLVHLMDGTTEDTREITANMEHFFNEVRERLAKLLAPEDNGAPAQV